MNDESAHLWNGEASASLSRPLVDQSERLGVMNLEKWYADVVTGDHVEILYLANLRIGPCVIGYSASYDSDRRAFQRTFHAGGIHLPASDAGQLAWPDAGSDIRWQGASDRELLLHTDAGGGRLTWNPLVLNGRPNSSPAATGYVERLDLEFPPWKLGLKELRWGRFCGRASSLVWIQWKGPWPKTLALLDGRPCRSATISDDLVEADGRHLRFVSPIALVDETLEDGALADLPLSRCCRPAAFFAGRERKWLASGILYDDGDVVDQGHVIFEVVSWP